ncbi:MAG: thioredoxin [Pseudomonadota bacterium]
MSFSQQTPAAPAYKDASIETFADDVLVASRERPVIVDFWAPWCGPCKQLAPAIEKAVADSQGAVSLVKVNIDENQMLAQQMRIQSIPAVLAFVDGQPVDGFVGALPDSDVKGFVDRLAQMAGGATSGAPDIEAALAAADEMFAAGDLAGALQLYAQIAELDPENAPALAGLARCRLASGDRDAAEQTLALVPEANRNDPAVAAVRAALDLAGTGGGDRAAAAAAVEANPDDLEARFALAEAEIAAGAMEAGVDQLLEIVGRDREWNEEAARKMLVTVFEALGPADPLTLRARRRLSSILFS